MTTKLLFMADCYLKEFHAKVLEKGHDYVVLDQTAFYPLGGGQPADTGTLNGVRVVSVVKDKGIVKHMLEKPLDSDSVKGVLDWPKRHIYMRMHTAQHLLSAIVLDRYGAETAGNQIDEESSRIDFFPVKFSEEDAVFLEKRFNELAMKGLPVSITFSSRDEVMNSIDERRRRLFSRVPESVKEIRVITIEGVDKVPCGGTHVKNTKELGKIRILRRENKGKETERVTFSLG